MSQRGEPRFHPISALSLIATAIEGMIGGTEEQHRLLVQARGRPYVLDDATVARVRRVFGEQAEYLDIYEEQLRRWMAMPLTDDQRLA